MMSKSYKNIIGQGGHMSKKVMGPMCEMTFKKEESKLDPQLVSGHSTFKAEGGLIQSSLPPSATHTKNT